MFKVFNRKHQQVDILENPQSPVIVDELNGLGELSFSVPTKYNHLELEGYIQVEGGHEYVIKEITTQGIVREVKCVLNIEEILGMIHTTFYSKDNDINDTMKIILNGTSWSFKNESTKTYTRNLYGKATSSYNMLQLLSTVFDIEFYFDTANKVVHIVDKVGADKGVYFMSNLNLRQLNHDSHTHQLITRVIPIGKDGLTIEDVNGGKNYLSNHSYSDKVIYGIWNASNYDDANKLKEDGERYLSSLAVPYQTYEVIVADLFRLSQGNYFEYNLGDIITIIDADSETRVKQRVVQRTYNLQEPDKDTLNVANKDRTFQDYYKRLQAIVDMADSVVNADGSINSDAIGDVDIDMDKITITPDQIVGSIVADSIKVNSIVAEHIKANQIQAHHITADSITAGHIKSDSIDTRHLKADSINANHIQAGTIVSGSGIIADGAIGSAQISELDASKLTAGTIDTSDVTIAGANSNLRIKGNRLQVFEGMGTNQVERVSLGDVNADGTVYGIRVRGKDGTTVLFDDNGVTQEGITNGAITNEKINPDANIDGGKLNIDSVITHINSNGSKTINSTRIDIDNKSLSTVIKEITDSSVDMQQKIDTNTSSITANTNEISLKVDSVQYEKDMSTMNTQLDKATSEVAVMSDKILLKVERADIDTALAVERESINKLIQNESNELGTNLDKMLEYIDNSFKDGIINDSERLLLEETSQQLLKEKADMDSQIEVLLGCSELAGTTELTELENAILAYRTSHARYIEEINKILNITPPPPTPPNINRQGKIHFIATDHEGASVLIQSSGGKNILIDANERVTSTQIINYLNSVGVTKLDYIIVTHYHSDHVGAMPEIMDAIECRNIVAYHREPDWSKMGDKEINEWLTKWYYDEFVKKCNSKGVTLKTPVEKEELRLGDGEYIKFFNTNNQGYENYNNLSFGLLYVLGDSKCFLANDMTYHSENYIGKGVIGKVNLHMTGHHGWNYSTQEWFAKELDAEYNIITALRINDDTRKNARSVLQKNNLPIYSQASNGTIVATVKPSSVSIDKGVTDTLVNCWWQHGETGDWYWWKNNGKLAKSETLYLGGKDYIFDSEGICQNPY